MDLPILYKEHIIIWDRCAEEYAILDDDGIILCYEEDVDKAKRTIDRYVRDMGL